METNQHPHHNPRVGGSSPSPAIRELTHCNRVGWLAFVLTSIDPSARHCGRFLWTVHVRMRCRFRQIAQNYLLVPVTIPPSERGRRERKHPPAYITLLGRSDSFDDEGGLGFAGEDSEDGAAELQGAAWATASESDLSVRTVLNRLRFAS